jgi:2-aminoadipate transaminase
MQMNYSFAGRMGSVQKSFIREILKVTENPQVISFAGGLPNPKLFPVTEISAATIKVLAESGDSVLQYSTTEGFLPLRQYLAARYLKNRGLTVDPDEILITNGSQQGLDLIGKVFLDQGDGMAIERPGYLGAIQAFSMFQPQFHPVPLLEDGVNITALAATLREHRSKLFYGVPNFQNPSGITYSGPNRREVADLLQQHDTLFVEDDPYGELRFIGNDLPSLKTYLGDRAILLGSFSKIIAPGMRLGWICAAREIMEKIIVAKQAADLHTSFFVQRVIYQYLADNGIDSHIARIREAYKRQREAMVSAIERHFPDGVQYTKPEGGMFLWVTLPEGISSLELFDLATRANVAFVPGAPFYTDGGGADTLRLNYSCSDEATIEEGIGRLGEAIKKLLTL